MTCFIRNKKRNKIEPKEFKFNISNQVTKLNKKNKTPIKYHG